MRKINLKTKREQLITIEVKTIDANSIIENIRSYNGLLPETKFGEPIKVFEYIFRLIWQNTEEGDEVSQELSDICKDYLDKILADEFDGIVAVTCDHKKAGCVYLSKSDKLYYTHNIVDAMICDKEEYSISNCVWDVTQY